VVGRKSGRKEDLDYRELWENGFFKQGLHGFLGYKLGLGGGVITIRKDRQEKNSQKRAKMRKNAQKSTKKAQKSTKKAQKSAKKYHF